MSFRNPWGLLALLFIIPIVLLYILKKQHEDRTVSSTMLWQQVSRDLQATRPWQRLRTRLLLILQIFAVILFALSLARPTFFGGEGGTHYITVIDTSARMQATDVKPSRMEASRIALIDFIDRMKVRDTMTIVRASQQPFVLTGPPSDKAVLKQYANEIEASNGKSDLSSAIQLSQTLLQDQSENGGQIHVYSDHILLGIGNQENLQFYVASGNGQNVAITHIAYDIRDNYVTALSRVANYGEERIVTLELKVDGMLQNVKEVSLSAEEEVPVYWSDIPGSAQEIEVSISEEDDLKLDNTGIVTINEDYLIKALMVTERNIFLERAISLRDDIELVKSNPGESLESTDFHLYIYDGSTALPDKLPEDGHIIVFSPSSHEGLGLLVEGELPPSGAKQKTQSQYSNLLQYVEPEDYQIAKAKKLNVPQGFSTLLQNGEGNPLLMIGEQDGRKMAVFSFSLHESNIPLKADFPILIQNLLNWMLPQDMIFAGQIFAGESLPISPLPDATSITITSPEGRKYEFDSYPAPVFYDTHEIGVYEIFQQAEDQSYAGRFVVSVPTDQVSDLRIGRDSTPGQAEEFIRTAASPFRRDIWMIAGWALLLLLLIEWWVYHRGL
ncbi:MAG: BatA and WFA domain-containing protein [Clostridia bacterium]|nr:BatA and WFA domain-containing protein [Clostridia bacterium]